MSWKQGGYALPMGLLSFAVLWEPGDGASAKAGLPSLAAVSALSATTLEGRAVRAGGLHYVWHN